MLKLKTIRTFIIVYYQFKSEWWSGNIKLPLLEGLIGCTNYVHPVWEFAADTKHFKLQCLLSMVLCMLGNFTDTNGPSICKLLWISVSVQFCNKIMQAASRHLTQPWEWNVCNIVQGITQHRNCKRFKVVSGESYNHWSSLHFI